MSPSIATESVPVLPEHIADCERWAERRGMPFPPHDMLSKRGFVVPGVAAWWLYLTDSSIAYTGFLIANPDVPKFVRDIGLDAVIDRVLAEAREAGARTIVVSVKIPAVQARLERHGFFVAEADHTLMGFAFGLPLGGA